MERLDKCDMDALLRIDNAIEDSAGEVTPSFMECLDRVFRLQADMLTGCVFGVPVEHLVSIQNQIAPWFTLVIDGCPVVSEDDIKRYPFDKGVDDMGRSSFWLGVMAALPSDIKKVPVLRFDFGKFSLMTLDVLTTYKEKC